MTFEEVMIELQSLGTAQNRKIYTNHGNDIDMFGVSIANLKKVLKPIRKDKELGKKLFHSQNSDAIYLSQWIVDPMDITLTDVEDIINLTSFYMILEHVIPHIVIQNKQLTTTIRKKWIASENPRKRQTAYSLYALVLGTYPNEEIDSEEVLSLLHHIEQNIHQEENRVRYTMNNFVISAGIYDPSFTKICIEQSERIGKIQVHMGNTSCKVPYAPDYIKKVQTMGRIGKKR